MVKLLSDDMMRKIFAFSQGWELANAGPNMTFNPECNTVDILGGSKGTILSTVSFSHGVHAWEIKVADMRTLCIGVAEKPVNPRSLADKWLGEIGYAISVSTCSGGTGFLWSKEQLGTATVRGFNPGQRVVLVLDMEDRSLDYFLDGVRVGQAFAKLPPGPLYPAASNGFDKAFCRGVRLDLEVP
eukprot:CAMPEP_0172161040 /NCGR_PEP_ID=MMETSP1050-20130122/5898_1 /TAXON_ID=233186 /ORGANISM="Cryptomonas curvata, Strain CCAP979/52" /LENGTH=184 /DNA_ID=CAMNT_0012830881 /DNA_START=54 /DNA_END=604 /DNA_ORIENTATION=+